MTDEGAEEAAADEVAAEAAVAVDDPPTRYGFPVTESRGQAVLHPPRSAWRDLAVTLLNDGWNMCVDVTAVDYSAYTAERGLPPGVEAERYEVVASFLSYERAERLRARVQVPDDDPSVESIYAVYPGIDFQEREVFDLMGITFEGHPDLSRILMPENWEGHPLRKDYAVGAIPVQFKAGGGSADDGGRP
ncbi:MAG: NADH-quinone oxidoreductase subunit C [Actinomycetota bacterium]